jgi:hypothetical protein
MPNRPFSYALEKRAHKRFQGYPIATVAYYGPNNLLATKVAVTILDEKEEVVDIKRWFSETVDIRRDENINRQILEFIESQEALSVGMIDGILGCPHEEDIDYPKGEKCPECPFWADRDRWAGQRLHYTKPL